MSADRKPITPHLFDTEALYAPIDGYPGYYVSSDGHVWSELAKGPTGRSLPYAKLLNGSPDDRGYPRFSLCLGGKKHRDFRAHTLVLQAFVGPCPAGMEACHNDGDKSTRAANHVRG